MKNNSVTPGRKDGLAIPTVHTTTTNADVANDVPVRAIVGADGTRYEMPMQYNVVDLRHRLCDTELRAGEDRAAAELFRYRPDPLHPLKLTDSEAEERGQYQGQTMTLREIVKAKGFTLTRFSDFCLQVSRTTLDRWLRDPGKISAGYALCFRGLLGAEVNASLEFVGGHDAIVCSDAPLIVHTPGAELLNIWGTLDAKDRSILEETARALHAAELGTDALGCVARRVMWETSHHPQI